MRLLLSGLTGTLLAAILTAPAAHALAPVPEGVWLMDGGAAVQVFDCGGSMCAKIAWLLHARDAQGLPDHDSKNPDKALRGRPICGITIISNLRADGANRWKGGHFYNPRDGKTYSVSATLRPDDVLVARVYSGLPIFGQTKTFSRVPLEHSEGWCP